MPIPSEENTRGPLELGHHNVQSGRSPQAQEIRFHLVVNIIQPPEGLPSLYELEQCNPALSESTVYKHLQTLVDAGVVEAVELCTVY